MNGTYLALHEWSTGRVDLVMEPGETCARRPRDQEVSGKVRMCQSKKGDRERPDAPCEFSVRLPSHKFILSQASWLVAGGVVVRASRSNLTRSLCHRNTLFDFHFLTSSLCPRHILLGFHSLTSPLSHLLTFSLAHATRRPSDASGTPISSAATWLDEWPNVHVHAPRPPNRRDSMKPRPLPRE